ncbi:hypothetical protein MN116_000486 [Schistosoma mekongi]|uniref:Uncharacterized protein n=1 Tax=Schistosoma mekongi TaxID=38744 RepID=A0AAE1ZE36_SCHME|nr:hypothetical protein MN116_000486 [Schistosoma mekongi]
MSALSERANLLMYELLLVNQQLSESTLERTGIRVGSIIQPVVYEKLLELMCENDSQIQPECLTEVPLSVMPSKTASEKQGDAPEPSTEQSVGDKPNVVSQLFTKIHSICPDRHVCSIAARPDQKVISRKVTRLSDELKKPQYASERSINPARYVIAIKRHSRRDLIFDSLIHSYNKLKRQRVASETEDVQCNEVLFLLPHKDPTTFRGGGV